MSAPFDRSPAEAVQHAPLAPREHDRPAALASESLLQGRRLVEILHNGEVYRLQATRLGKLILTK
ncbi:MAG: hemin uptake protein HemP [Comamonadaceae bacterium]|nr:MAG: hemin uptake protein HemP [Comamonadaceae bacterium]